MKKLLPYIAVGVAVYMLRNQIGRLPLVDKLPTF